MTRTYCRQCCPGDKLMYDVISRIYDNKRLVCMFTAIFDNDFRLVSLTVGNIELPNPQVGIELQTFLCRAYKVCSGVDNGMLEFEYNDHF